jgi:transcription elongation factor Elf1
MSVFACPQCKGGEFIRLEVIDVNEKGRVVQTIDNGLLKCSNCGTRLQVTEDGEIGVNQMSAQATASRPRVRSSVSAGERRIGDDGGLPKRQM